MINFTQAFELTGAGVLAVLGVLVWLAGTVASRRAYIEDRSSGCMVAAITLVFVLGCLLLLWMALVRGG
ncbi:MAG: hypothetical protein H6649_03900 [Caldilineae bacterium]|nr:hypothetical protein [Anaerolineae bacterium]MCB0199276.1 hypothetical protein [Anaerolineae bacterium]MCB0206670.1 hypothetical protein [Anaerolineae bacterium]MCB9153187.1 hypothetical protein [Caldilineae bacterium]